MLFRARSTSRAVLHNPRLDDVAGFIDDIEVVFDTIKF